MCKEEHEFTMTGGSVQASPYSDAPVQEAGSQKPEEGGSSEELPDLMRQLEERYAEWRSSASAVLEVGGVKMSELDELIEGAQQFLWGPESMSGVPDVLAQLKEARQWASRVRSLGSLEFHVMVSNFLTRHVLFWSMTLAFLVPVCQRSEHCPSQQPPPPPPLSPAACPICCTSVARQTLWSCLLPARACLPTLPRP